MDPLHNESENLCKKYSYKVLRNIVFKLAFWRTSNLSFLRRLANFVLSEIPQKWKDKQTGCLTGKQKVTRKSVRNRWALIPLWKIFSLLVWAPFSIVSLIGCIQKIRLFYQERSTRYSIEIFSCDSWNLCCTHSEICLAIRKPNA